MDNNQFDQYIKQQLESVQTPLKEGSWGLFEQMLEAEGLTAETFLDESVIEQMKNYTASPIPGDWDIMANLLDEEESAENDQFDKGVKQQIDGFEAPYNHTTWPLLAKRLEEAEAIRRRLYVAKVLELACILLFVITLFNFYPKIDQHFLQPVKDQLKKKELVAELNSEQQAAGSGQQAGGGRQQAADSEQQAADSEQQAAGGRQRAADSERQKAGSEQQTADSERRTAGSEQQTTGSEQLIVSNQQRAANGGQQLMANSSGQHTDNEEQVMADDQQRGANSEQKLTDPIATMDLGILHAPIFANKAYQNLTENKFEASLHTKKIVRFGIRSSADINILFFPADNFYTDGNQISFEEQHLPALGYGGGFSIGWFGKRVGYEFGLLYSSKSFKPGRQLLVGNTLQNSKLDFAGVQIDVLSVPVHVNYYIKAKGKFRVYAIGGMDFSLISQANYDLNIRNTGLRALSIQVDPRFLKEASRIREHILDGAKFSSKSFVTVHAGFGVERYVNHNLALFAEPTYIYQVPFGILNTTNGKHLQSVSIHFGARLPIN